MMKIGDTFNIAMPSFDRYKFYKCHVLAIVEDHIVYKWYGKHKQYWHYNLKHINLIKIDIERTKKLMKRV